jgi:hypothetical protein
VFTWFLYGIPSAALINMVGYYGVVQNMMNTAVFWFTLILAVTAALLPTYIISVCGLVMSRFAIRENMQMQINQDRKASDPTQLGILL